MIQGIPQSDASHCGARVLPEVHNVLPVGPSHPLQHGSHPGPTIRRFRSDWPVGSEK